MAERKSSHNSVPTIDDKITTSISCFFPNRKRQSDMQGRSYIFEKHFVSRMFNRFTGAPPRFSCQARSPSPQRRRSAGSRSVLQGIFSTRSPPFFLRFPEQVVDFAAEDGRQLRELVRAGKAVAGFPGRYGRLSDADLVCKLDLGQPLILTEFLNAVQCITFFDIETPSN